MEIEETSGGPAVLFARIRTHLGNDWYFLAGLPTPVSRDRVVELGMICWFMKAWRAEVEAGAARRARGTGTVPRVSSSSGSYFFSANLSATRIVWQIWRTVSL